MTLASSVQASHCPTAHRCPNFGDPNLRPNLYYGAPNPKAECSKGLEIPKQNDESAHCFEKEHEIYENLQKESRRTVYS